MAALRSLPLPAPAVGDRRVAVRRAGAVGGVRREGEGGGGLSDGSPNDDLTDRQLDGFACIGCGREDGAMKAYGIGPRGLLFAHEPCIERLTEEARDAT